MIRMTPRNVAMVISLCLSVLTFSDAFIVNVNQPRQASRIFALSDHGPNKPGKLPVHHLDPHPTSSSIEHNAVGVAPTPDGAPQDSHGIVEHGVVGMAKAPSGSQDPSGFVEHGLMAEKTGQMPDLEQHPTSASVEHTLLKPWRVLFLDFYHYEIVTFSRSSIVHEENINCKDTKRKKFKIVDLKKGKKYIEHVQITILGWIQDYIFQDISVAITPWNTIIEELIYNLQH